MVAHHNLMLAYFFLLIVESTLGCFFVIKIQAGSMHMCSCSGKNAAGAWGATHMGEPTEMSSCLV